MRLRAKGKTKFKMPPKLVGHPRNFAPPPPILPPVIFLDVDGVLHPTRGDFFFEPRCMLALRAIIEATGAVVVLSSHWQVNAEGRADVDAALRRFGLPAIVARTVNGGATPGSGEERRAREIAAWVRSHAPACAAGFVALDDLPLDSVATPPAFVPILPTNRFVRTDEHRGLTMQDAQRAIALLGGRNPHVPPLPPPQPEAAKGVPRDEQGGEKQQQQQRVWRTDARYGGAGAAG